MRTLLYTLGLAFAANASGVFAQHKDIASSDARLAAHTAVASDRAVVTKSSSRREKAQPVSAMPVVKYYSIAEGEDEDIPPGMYATFLPSVPDTVQVFDDATLVYTTHHIDAGKEMIHGDSASVVKEVERRMEVYAGSGTLSPHTTSFVTRSGFIPIEEIGPISHRFAVKPSHFRIAPGAIVSASVHLEGDEDLSTVLCFVSGIDYERNTFTIETSKTVSVGETINWVIINYPE
jgi:hypothetical protein